MKGSYKLLEPRNAQNHLQQLGKCLGFFVFFHSLFLGFLGDWASHALLLYIASDGPFTPDDFIH
jgi:hypothetical protein